MTFAIKGGLGGGHIKNHSLTAKTCFAHVCLNIARIATAVQVTI